MSKKYNVAVIGYGWAAGAHIAAINATSQGQVTAVWSSRKLNSAELSLKHGSSITAYTDLKAMLASKDIHVVDITSYPDQHSAQFIAAAKAGKHIIVEKPLAIEWDEILAMKKAAKSSGVKTAVCFECRYSSQFTATKAIIDAGLIGSIHYGEVDYYHGIGPWYGQYRWNTKKKLGGSALLTAGCHAMDALLLCMDGEVDEVTSYATQSKNPMFAAYEYRTSATTILKFKNGAVGKVAAIVDCLQPYYFHSHLVGSEGSILDNKFHSQKIAGLNRQAWSQMAVKMVDSGDVSDHPYQSQFQAFFDAIDAGKEMPLTSLADGFRSHRVVAAADKSAKEGRPVKLSEIPAA